MPENDPSIDDVPVDELGNQICELSAHIAAATYRFLRLLSAFDRRVGWAGWGLKSCAHWLNWKCGLDLRSAREKIRVARALDALPLISAAFARGEISYSKVRALTRIATPASEEALLVMARHGTAQHVEKIVRAYRRCLPADVADANAAYRKRYVEFRYDDDGSLLIRARLAPEEGALVVKAVEKLREDLRKTNREVPGADYDSAGEPPHDRADALVELARRGAADDPRSPSSSSDRYQVFVHVDADVVRGGDGACHVELGSGLASETAQRLMCDVSFVGVVRDADGNVLDIGRKTRTIPPQMRRALQVRDGGCRFPGCTNYLFTDGHHIKHWSHNGKTKLPNLVLLCPFHHRLMHEGVFNMRAEPDGRFTFFRPDGYAVETAELRVEPGGVERANAEIGLRIDARTPNARWEGEVCDYGVAVEGLLIKNGLASPPSENGPAEPSPDSNASKVLALMHGPRTIETRPLNEFARSR